MNISIIKPKTEHAEAIAAICAAGWRQTVEGKLSEEYQKRNVSFWYNHERVTNDINRGAYTHAARIDSALAGVIGGGMTGPTTGEIFLLYVEETYRYQGIGKRLLEQLTREQIDLGATEQWVSVQEGNQRGIPFYEARGFIYKAKRVTLTETGEEQVSLRYARRLHKT
ncbi:Ribosomal protein S18 acetylase RimI [Lentibacillus persicus]|uniref:Ribosomal protein S18 acetylase RimI n=1 Tax=Lentibacillus persicus TaxID=640948 RepID=A0A1I1TNU2_9BACI|nr:GNAT family N-acetyltransferase [Lentibacillus persicus]SFD60179.1 Ribosomal protein S18 acetylase RimI [Lentibacillus persicus]